MAKDERLKKDRLRQFEARQVLHQTQRQRRKKDQWLSTVVAIFVVAVAGVAVWAYGAVGPGAPKQVPSASISENRTWVGDITLSGVTLPIELYGDLAPQAVANFIQLTRDDFYSETTCHRLTTERLFVLQCGDPLGSGLGNPGYVFGPIENAPEDNFYPAGTLAMARGANDAETQGSQFFIVYEDSTIPADSAGGYTVLGRVTGSLDEFRASFVEPGIQEGLTDGAPVARAVIESITIR